MNQSDVFSSIRKYLPIISIVSLGLIIAVFLLSSIGILNDEANARNRVSAQQNVVKSFQDKAWKTVQQKAQVTDKYATDFAEIYPKLMSGRYSGKNPMFTFIAESNPTLDASIYQSLSNAIESQREDLVSQEMRLVDLDMQHDIPFDRFPTGMILSMFGRSKTDIILITSTKTNETFENGGVENDLDVFTK
jgi:hypothetical protein